MVITFNFLTTTCGAPNCNLKSVVGAVVCVLLLLGQLVEEWPCWPIVLKPLEVNC